MAHPFRTQSEEHTKEIKMQNLYDSLNTDLKSHYREMQLYKNMLLELGDEAHKLGESQLERNLGNTIATIDKYLFGDTNIQDIMHTIPVFNKVLETMIIETKLDLCDKNKGDLIY